MFSFKKIPIWVILLLIILVTILLFEFLMYCRKPSVKESMLDLNAIGYNNSGQYGVQEVALPNIKGAVKARYLYDNIFYFPKSGKIALVYPNEAVNAINEIHIIKRDFDGATDSADVHTITESSSTNIDPTGEIMARYKSWYHTPISPYNNPSNSQLFYIPFGYKTYIHIVNLGIQDTAPNHFGFFASQNGLLQNKSENYNNTFASDNEESGSFVDVETKMLPAATNWAQVNNINLGSTTISTAYQLWSNVYFNMKNGDLYVKHSSASEAAPAPAPEPEAAPAPAPAPEPEAAPAPAPEPEAAPAPAPEPEAAPAPAPEPEAAEAFTLREGQENMNEVKFYTRSGAKVDGPTEPTGTGPDPAYQCWMKKDKEMGNIIIYVANGKNTIVSILHKNETGSYDLVNVKRFNKNGLVTSETFDDEIEDELPLPDENTGETGEGESVPDPLFPQAQMIDVKNNISDYYKWYWYWNSSGSMPVHFSEDYMLKTQVVPPVCPMCPSCPKQGGCCNNCGGTGGSGTVDKNGKSVINDKETSQTSGRKTPIADAYGKTLDTTSDLLKSGGSGARDIAGEVIGLGKDTVTGGVDLAKDTVTGGVDLAKDTVTGTVGLAKDTVTGTVGLAKDTVGGVADFITGLGSGATNVSNNQYGSGYNQAYGQPQQYTQPQQGMPGQMRQQRPPLSTNDPYTYNGQLPQRPSANFLPRTADFSSFAK